MNVIIANKFKDALASLEIDVIKKLDGEFDVDTIIDTFANFYFNRMILDITALQDGLNIATIQKLSASLDASKIILFLSDDPRINNSFLSKIISLGIYNFTNDLTGITYLMNNPNSYRDVAQYHDLAMEDERELKNAINNPDPFGMDMQKPELMKTNNGVASPNNFMSSGPKIIGFKDLTEDAGATTLVYMLKKNLADKKVLAVEINNQDFSYFNDSDLISISANQINQYRGKFNQFDIVLIDINNSGFEGDGTCSDIIYLLEPSTIKLNALMRKDREILHKLKDKKIVLNKSLLTVSDVKEFEYEAKAKMFYNIPPLDERKDSQMVLDNFLDKLGITTDKGSTGFFSIFKR